MTKTAWTEHLKACKGLGLSKKEIREWYWAEKEAKEEELEAAKESSDEEDVSDVCPLIGVSSESKDDSDETYEETEYTEEDKKLDWCLKFEKVWLGSLPEGWTSHIEHSYDSTFNIFYFHEATGTTQWERPYEDMEMRFKKPVEEDDDEDEEEEEEEEEEEVEEEEEEEEEDESILPFTGPIPADRLLSEKSAQDYINEDPLFAELFPEGMTLNICPDFLQDYQSVPVSKIRRPAFHRP
jgi:hypothetical protein